MNSNKVKKIVIGLLTPFMIYIWWGNLEYFQDTANNTVLIKETKTIKSSLVKNIWNVDYKRPRVNPFKRFTTNQQNNTIKTNKIIIPPQPKINKITETYFLSGIIKNQGVSQAVINSKNKKTIIVALNEEVDGWILTIINDNNIILKKDNVYDTLWLWEDDK